MRKNREGEKEKSIKVRKFGTLTIKKNDEEKRKLTKRRTKK